MRTLGIALFLLMAIACKSVKKDLAKSSEKTELKTKTTETNESTTSTLAYQTELFQRFSSSRFDLDGLLRIEFDSLTRLDISHDGTISATGYAPKILSHTTQSNRDTTSILSDIRTRIKEDSTGRGEKEEVTKMETEIQEINKTIERKPSLIPWLGFGIVLVGLVWFLIWRLKT